MPDPHEHPVTLARCMTEAEATLIAQELHSAGIEARTLGNVSGSMRLEAPSTVDVLVHADDADAARTVIERIRAEAGRIDWSKVDVTGGKDDGG